MSCIEWVPSKALVCLAHNIACIRKEIKSTRVSTTMYKLQMSKTKDGVEVCKILATRTHKSVLKVGVNV